MNESKNKSYTMQEIADSISINKSTVYRYLKKNGIEPAMVDGNTNLYSASTLQRLKKHFNRHNVGHEKNKSANEILIETLQQQVKSLQDELQNEKLRSDKALVAKDKQIDELNNRLKESHQLQLGLQKKLKMLPEPKETTVIANSDDIVDKNDSDNDENTKKAAAETDTKPGIFHRLFRKI